ncbi:unnamed protein product [Sphagnum jensenii]|uniref:Uncharacterized protein n=1 Tax=Sphagnum jensenii TaxID=128206 RepID=A0ABP1AVI0_9BRYO
MAFNVAPLLCPFIIALDIFTLKKDIAKMHYSNAELNVPDKAPLVVYQVVSQAVETLANAPKQKGRKLNLHLTGFEVKEGKTENELMQQLNTELLQGQMRLRVKVVVVAKQQQPATLRASTSTTSTRPDAMLFKFVTSEDYQVALRGCKGLVGTKLGLDEDLTPTQ